MVWAWHFICVPSDLAIRRFCFFVSVIMTENQSNNRFPMVVSSWGWHSPGSKAKKNICAHTHTHTIYFPISLKHSNFEPKAHIGKILIRYIYRTFAWTKAFARHFYHGIVNAIVVIQSATRWICAIVRATHKCRLFWCIWASFAFPFLNKTNCSVLHTRTKYFVINWCKKIHQSIVYIIKKYTHTQTYLVFELP